MILGHIREINGCVSERTDIFIRDRKGWNYQRVIMVSKLARLCKIRPAVHLLNMFWNYCFVL